MEFGSRYQICVLSPHRLRGRHHGSSWLPSERDIRRLHIVAFPRIESRSKRFPISSLEEEKRGGGEGGGKGEEEEEGKGGGGKEGGGRGGGGKEGKPLR